MTVTAPVSASVPRDGQVEGDIRSHLAGLDVAHLHTLLLRCGQGDQEAFAAFYQLTSPVLAALVAARRLPPHAAETVMVDVYVTIWRRARRFAGSGCSVRQWTLTLLTNTLTDSHRSRQR